MIEVDTQLPLEVIRTDGGTQPRVALSQDTIADYAQSMMEGSMFPPVVVFHDGSDYWLADGFHRYFSTKQLCREVIDAEVKQGTRRDAVLYSVGANALHGLRRNNADKRNAVRTLLLDQEWSQWSDREIARRCGVTHPFVSSVRSSLVTVTSEARTYTTKHGTVATMNTSNIGQEQPRVVQSLTSLDDIFPGFTSWQQSRPIWADPLPSVGETLPSPIKSPALTALQSSESNEWYTPSTYMEIVRQLMNGIDLDPASCAQANVVVQASHYYTEDDNGLAYHWHGRVWLNPPYGYSGGRSNQELWTQYLLEQYQEGFTTEAVLLVNANTEARWFQPLYNHLICFTDHRIKFYNALGASSQPTQGNAFVYFGPNRDRFVTLFRQFGTVLRRAEG